MGIGFIFEYPAAKTSIGLIGGAYLLWMGWQMFKTCLPLQGRDSNGAGSSIVRDSLRSDSVDNGAVSLAVAGTATRPFMTGLVLSATNPYFILWWATVGLNMAKDAASFGFLAVVLFAIVHSLCDMTWLELISFTSYKGTKLLNDTNQKYILIFCAAAIIFFGFYFIIKSFF
ncbi:MAG: leucine export protein LeuE [Planctomycetes bacterium ADurb.Bin401]|nr:MAG: leucine export protein LeuE [Planctomycetes bacterium ADurb.Bin401]